MNERRLDKAAQKIKEELEKKLQEGKDNTTVLKDAIQATKTHYQNKLMKDSTKTDKQRYVDALKSALILQQAKYDKEQTIKFVENWDPTGMRRKLLPDAQINIWKGYLEEKDIAHLMKVDTVKSSEILERGTTSPFKITLESGIIGVSFQKRTVRRQREDNGTAKVHAKGDRRGVGRA